jgi:hypothetical protein
MNKKTGEVVKLSDGKPEIPRPNTEPKIVGAAPLGGPEKTKTLDKRSPVEPQAVEVHVHEEVVTVRQHVRSRPLRKDEPDVRVRTMTPEAKEAWARAKKAGD